MSGPVAAGWGVGAADGVCAVADRWATVGQTVEKAWAVAAEPGVGAASDVWAGKGSGAAGRRVRWLWSGREVPSVRPTAA